jgi:hypothetical protein
MGQNAEATYDYMPVVNNSTGGARAREEVEENRAQPLLPVARQRRTTGQWMRLQMV